MGNNVTEMVFILDKSGSMSGFESDTIGGFNSTIEKQKKEPGKALVTTVLFSYASKKLHDRMPLDEITPLTDKDYCVGGGTALYDAIGAAINEIAENHKLSKPDEIPEHTVFVITTDGYENSSREYSREKVKNLIDTYTEKCGWQFIFMAANIDAAETAESIGISRKRSMNYVQTKEGIASQFDTMSFALKTVRSNKSLDDEAWKNNESENKKK